MGRWWRKREWKVQECIRARGEIALVDKKWQKQTFQEIEKEAVVTQAGEGVAPF